MEQGSQSYQLSMSLEGGFGEGVGEAFNQMSTYLWPEVMQSRLPW